MPEIKKEYAPDINSQTVQNLLIAYFHSKRMIQANQTGYVFLYSYAFSLAEYFKCKKEIEELKNIYYGCKPGEAGFWLPAIDAACYKATIFGEPLGKTYNYKYKQKWDLNKSGTNDSVLCLGDLKAMLSERAIKIDRVFNKICIDNDIPQTFNLAMLDAKGNMGMPELKE